jgi:Spy/CpxP family protein refolding chaperone
MKKVFALFFVGMLMVQGFGLAFADEKDQSKMHEKRIEKLTKELNLTADQKDKVSSILKESGEKIKAEMEKVREVIKQDTDQKIKAVLTPEQAVKYDAQKAERRAKMEKKMKEENKDNLEVK